MRRIDFDVNDLRVGAALLATSLSGTSLGTFALNSTQTPALADEMDLSGLDRMSVAPDAGVYRLTDGELQAMRKLLSECEEVAFGTRKSTTFTVDGGTLLGKAWFGKDDLGIDPIVESSTGQLSFNRTATQILMNSIANHFHTMLGAMLNEGPAALAWLDKTAQNRVSVDWEASYENGGWKVCPSKITLSLSPTSDCAGTDGGVSPAAVSRIKGAVGLAQAIVDANEGEATKARLSAYRDAICGLASYDRAAADDASTPFGSPWQLTSVLDDDPSTMSVCEGYSKAFRLMTELSEHTQGTCILVTGTMKVAGGSSEAHMWNVVSMPDGRNYLVDVTNSDTGTVGSKGGLFISPATGSPETGYVATTEGGSQVLYSYDSETLSLYTRDALVLSEQPYVEDPEKEDEIEEAGEASNPVVPTNPSTPDNPENPDNPDEPDTPNDPDTPDVPDVPGTPDTPDEPSKWENLSVGDKVEDEEGNEYEVTVVPDGEVDYKPITTIADLIDAGFQVKPVEGSDEPETPETPDTPDNPDDPENPDTSDNPDDPSIPDTPDDPEVPDTPDTPDQSADPADPVDPAEPTDPTEPTAPTTPATPTGDNEAEESNTPSWQGDDDTQHDNQKSQSGSQPDTQSADENEKSADKDTGQDGITLRGNDEFELEPIRPSSPSRDDKESDAKSGSDSNGNRRGDKDLVQTGGDDLRVIVLGALVLVSMGGTVLAYKARE